MRNNELPDINSVELVDLMRDFLPPPASVNPQPSVDAKETAVDPAHGKSVRRSSIPKLAAIVTALGLLVVIGIRIANARVARELAETKSRYELVTEANMPSKSGGIRPAAVFTSELDPRAENYHLPTGVAEVKIQNSFLPVKFSWKLREDKTPNKFIGVGKTTTLDLPTGNAVILSVSPSHTNNWIQPYSVTLTRNGESEYFGSTVGNTILTLQDKDQLFVQMSLPSPPWNATLMQIRGHWALLTLERPDPRYKTKSFSAGVPDEKRQPLPNTMVVWGVVGTNAMAKELAHFCKSTSPVQVDQWGKWRGRYNTSISLPFGNGKVTPVLASVSDDELATEIEYALERMKVQRNRSDVSIAELLDQASHELEDTNGLHKKILEVLDRLK